MRWVQEIVKVGIKLTLGFSTMIVFMAVIGYFGFTGIGKIHGNLTKNLRRESSEHPITWLRRIGIFRRPWWRSAPIDSSRTPSLMNSKDWSRNTRKG